MSGRQVRRQLMRVSVVRALAPAFVLLVAAACGSATTDSTTKTTTTTTTTGPISFKSNPCSITGTLTLASAQTARVDCTNGGTTVTVAGNGASYLVVAELPTDNAVDGYVSYNVAASSVTAAASGARLAMIRSGPSRSLSMVAVRSREAQARAYTALRAKEGRLVASGAFARTSSNVRASLARTGSSGVSASVAPPVAGSIRSFHVLSSFSNTPTWKTVAAQLAYVGNNVLLYIDTLAPANGFTPTQLQQFGQYFDQTLFPIDTGAFGLPSDIDGNGHVIMLMSPVVNADTPTATCQNEGYVAGFFDSEDFDGPSDPESNQGEIFYSVVPDPSGKVSCMHSVADIGLDVPATFMHELQHLINFSNHVILHGGAAEYGWLDEGLSINAEELGSLYYENKCPPPSCRTDPTQLFPDSAEGFVNGFLYDSYEYVLLPDTASVTLHSDADDGFSWRGGDWALVHYLGDQFGRSVWKKLEDANAIGAANIAAATGEAFPTLFSDFSVALFADSMPGLPRNTSPAVDRFVTRNLRQMWSRLYATSGPASDIPYANPLLVYPITSDTSSAVMVPGTMSFYRLDTPDTSATVIIQFSAPGGKALAPTLNPQLAIFRLPVGQ